MHPDDYSREARLAVKHGAYWLDQAYPEWLGLIKLETLDLAGIHTCVLGQIGGSWTGFEMFFDEGVGFLKTAEFMVEHGFDIPDESLDISYDTSELEFYDVLTNEWKHYIKEARHT